MPSPTINKKEAKDDLSLTIFVVSYFFVHALNLFVKLVIGNIPYWNILSRIPLAFFMVFAVYVLLKRNARAFFVAEMIALFLFAYTFILAFASVEEYFDVLINVVFVFIPLGMSVALISDKSRFIDVLYRCSWPIHLVLVFAMIINGTNVWTYSMSLGYALTFQALIVLERFFQKKRFIDLILVLVDVVLVLIFGSRGPMLCFLVFFLLELCFSKRIKMENRVAYCVIIVVLIAFLTINSSWILDLLSGLSNRFSHYSRTLVKLISGDFLSDSGRSTLTNHYLGMISDNWLFGYGVAGGWLSPGDYPHNLIIELLLSYGIVVGPVFVVLLLALVFRGLLTRRSDYQRLFFIFAAYDCCLLISNSYVLSPHFFILLFLGVFLLKNDNVSKRKKLQSARSFNRCYI